MKVTWFGHSGFLIKDGGKTILIDPWLEGNPLAETKAEDIKKADAVFVTHDHLDHGYDDAVKICKATGATFVSIFEVANRAKNDGIENAIGGNIGGSAEVAGIPFTFTFATHSSTAGHPIGFIIKMPSMVLYHAGDTGIFSDMKLLGELYDPDIVFLPIGSLFTMGPKEAAKALQLIGCKLVVPMHFKTFPVLVQDTNEFKKLTGPMIDVCELKPNEETEITK